MSPRKISKRGALACRPAALTSSSNSLAASATPGLGPLTLVSAQLCRVSARVVSHSKPNFRSRSMAWPAISRADGPAAWRGPGGGGRPLEAELPVQVDGLAGDFEGEWAVVGVEGGGGAEGASHGAREGPAAGVGERCRGLGRGAAGLARSG